MLLLVDQDQAGSDFTQLKIMGSMESAKSSILHDSSFHRASSLVLVKGNAKLPQMDIMWSALRLTTLPC